MEEATLNVLDDWLGFAGYLLHTQAHSNDRHNYVCTERATTTFQTYLLINVRLLFLSTNSLSLQHCDLPLPLIHKNAFCNRNWSHRFACSSLPQRPTFIVKILMQLWVQVYWAVKLSMLSARILVTGRRYTPCHGVRRRNARLMSNMIH